MSELKRTHDEIQIEWTVDILQLSGIKSGDEYIFGASQEFVFGPSTMRLKLAAPSLKNLDVLTLGVILTNKTNYFMQRHFLMLCTYGLKNPDGTVEVLGEKIMRSHQDEIKNNFVKLSDVIRRKLQQKTSCDTTITFTFKVELVHDDEESQRKRLRKEDVLSQDFKRLFSDMLASDITLHVKDKEFQAHKIVLYARSKVFANKFQQKTPETKTDIIRISDCDPVSFPKFLEFLYCGELDELSPQNALNLYETAEKYDVLELKIFCADVLLGNMTIENFSDIASLGDRYNDSKLKSVSLDFFNEYHSDIVQTSGWDSLKRNNSALHGSLLNGLKEFLKTKCDRSIA